MIPTARISELKKIKAKGVNYRGIYRGRWFHVGIAFECEDISAVMRLGAELDKVESLRPLLDSELHIDNADNNILVSFQAYQLNPFDSQPEIQEMMSMIEEAEMARIEMEEENERRR